MPLVALATSHREARLAAAADRWSALLNAHPDLEPAVSLQKSLVGLVVDLADAVESRPLPRLSLPPRYLAAKLLRGTPAFAAEPIPLPVAVLAHALLALCDALARGGAGDSADHIKRALAEGRMNAGSLLTASL